MLHRNHAALSVAAKIEHPVPPPRFCGAKWNSLSMRRNAGGAVALRRHPAYSQRFSD